MVMMGNETKQIAAMRRRLSMPDQASLLGQEPAHRSNG
jgi:hypothetical protein